MSAAKQPAVYIMATGYHGTMYLGVTSHLAQRAWQHKEHFVEGFTKRYDVTRLVWYEVHESMEGAILREKQIKKWRREWKLRLVEEINPAWEDLLPSLA